MKKISTFFIILNLLFGLSGDQLAEKIHYRKTPRDSKVDLVMTLTNKKGKQRSASIRSILKNDGQKQIMWFLSPPDDKGIAFLKLEHDEKDDEMKMWLPAFKKIRRISATKKSDNFMGSDMSYEDMSSRQLNEYNFKIIGDIIYDSTFCYLLESKPAEYIITDYSKHITWVDSILFLPLKEQSFDKTERLFKEKYYKYNLINEYYVLSEIQVYNIQNDHSTNLKFQNIKLDVGINDEIFHEKYLKRPPQ